MTMHLTGMTLIKVVLYQNFLTLQGDKVRSQQSTPPSQMQGKKKKDI